MSDFVVKFTKFTVWRGMRALVRSLPPLLSLVRHLRAGGDPFAPTLVIGRDKGRANLRPSAAMGPRLRGDDGLWGWRGSANYLAVRGEGRLTSRNNVAKLTKLTRNGGVRASRVSDSGTKFTKCTVSAASALVCCGDEKERAAHRGSCRRWNITET